MSKYIIELGDSAKKVVAIYLDEGTVWTGVQVVEDLEELNSDYINDHFGDLQDTIYKKGLHDGESKCRYCNEYQRGLEDAWEAAKKIADMWTRMDNDELLAIFGITERIGHSTINSLFGKQTANEAMLNLEAYEEKQKADDEIKVGDELEHTVSGYTSKAIFLEKIGDDEDWYNCLFWTGCGVAILSYPKSQFKRTGKHHDIDKILAEMRT